MKGKKKMQITHDVHTHTLISRCCHDSTATAENYIRIAAELGHNVLGISNHLWDESVSGASKWYADQSFGYILEEKPMIRSLDPCGMKILFGAEIEYCAMSDTLALRASNACVLDYVLIPHSHTHMKGFVISDIPEAVEFRKKCAGELCAAFPWMSEKTSQRLASGLSIDDMSDALVYSRDEYEQRMAEFLLDSYESMAANPEFEKIVKTVPTIIAHPLSPSEPAESRRRIYDKMDKDRLKNAYRTAARMGFAYDINIATFKFYDDLDNDPMVKIMRDAKNEGVKFTFGTDAHSCESLHNIKKADPIAQAIGLTEQDLFPLVLA